MTLIAGFLKDECPILMGDLLISSQGDSNDKEIVFPTVGKISNKDISCGEYKPTGFCQKVNLLSPKLAVAWAGAKIYASSFMKEVIKCNLHNTPSRESLSKVFNEIDKGQGKFSIIGLYRNGTEMIVFEFNTGGNGSLPLGFKWFKADGTGYKFLLESLSNLTNSNITSGQPNKLERAISEAVHLITDLISQEILTAIPLQNLFGAGYEIVHPLRRDLAKFSNLTYLFWKAEEETQGTWKLQPFPFLGSNYSYYKDILVIRSIRLSSNVKPFSCKVDSDELHVISPTYRTVVKDELVGYAPVSLNSSWICNTFLWKDHNGNMGAFATFGRYVSQSPPLIWKNEFKSDEGIDVNAQFVQSSISKIAAQALER
ncbi:MAG: hypothetical protein PHP73_02470 [Candidatus Omnitrophica bacterium]|nr:hypothetical protein [Candidatus Omnitrophota bacterium]